MIELDDYDRIRGIDPTLPPPTVLENLRRFNKVDVFNRLEFWILPNLEAAREDMLRDSGLDPEEWVFYRILRPGQDILHSFPSGIELVTLPGAFVFHYGRAAGNLWVQERSDFLSVFARLSEVFN